MRRTQIMCMRRARRPQGSEGGHLIAVVVGERGHGLAGTGDLGAEPLFGAESIVHPAKAMSVEAG